ncbi:SWI/SNF-related matrix-associated actin-dependent regulator of chromatin subfamily A containing DEAD/H box 1 homolog [Leptopilina heterotoma]|uniref:SWI/SNF-related matrix-associated actin-dependent regulator of chromatin subfamily A containing DEAD/H box 1 homolog n=1 Tax=Leptopilina heterotoma TaxID=63436 RepID=UPI001CA85F06|nr:SWI/SNF-related matrix-associated actin-dependent regulator of chromatin subfamily A containing DEAD/H box 1 homolog [Leptopilina heterotoma]
MSDINSEVHIKNKTTSLLTDLRRFRFKKIVKKMNTSDEDSNMSPEITVRRKAVNRIEDSDSDVGSSTKLANSDSDRSSESNDKQEKIKYLIKLFPKKDSEQLEVVLAKCDWNLEEAEESLNKRRKRSHAPKGKKRNKKRRKMRDDEEDVDVDSDEANYSSKVFDSDDDSDVEVSNHLTSDKKAVLDFMQIAMPSEFLLMHQCTQKKVDAIIAARPFTSWRDIVGKFQNNKFLDTELLNSAQSLLATRSVVENLMKKCLRLSTTMEKAVSAGSATITQQPAGIPDDLKLAPYQMVGLNWLAVMHAHGVNGILADEMGLGKTIQVIAFLSYLKESGFYDENDGPHLIVVPSSTMENWCNELERWSPDLKVVKYYGSQDERRDMRMGWRSGDLDDVDIILTTYNLISSTPEERRLFRVMPIQYVVFDEAHMLKNMGTIRYENLVKINAKHRILLTGTPLQNNLLELISLLIFVMPTLFAGKQADLKSLFSKNPKVSATKDSKDKPLFELEQVKNAKQIMKPFVLRRLKSEVLRDLPKKSEEVMRVPMIEKQKEMYRNLLSEFSDEANKHNVINGVGMMMQLRKLANHPLLFRSYYTEDKLKTISKRLAMESGYKQKNPDYVFEDLLWMSDYQINQLSRTFKSIAGFGLPLDFIPESGKLKALDELLPKLKEEGHRILIFSQFTMVLDILTEYLTLRNHRHYRLDGQTPVTERQEMIDEFTHDKSIFIFLLSTRAGGLGINLTAADTVIIHDIDFNPYNDKQAEDRSHRVGQTKPVRIIRLLSEGTIEEGMYQIAQEKLHLEQQITGNEENEAGDKKGVLKLLKITLGLDIHNKSLTLSPVKNSHDLDGLTEKEMDNCELDD